MAIPSESLTAKDRFNILDVKSLKMRVFHVCLWCHRSNGSWHGHFRSSGSFGPHVSLPWSIVKRMQATYTLSHILGERCLEVRTGKNSLNFPQTTQHLVAMALSQPPPEHSISPVSTEWSFCRHHYSRQQRGTCQISGGHPGHHQRLGTWSSSCWHRVLCQPSVPWAWRYTPLGCLRWSSA